MVDGVALTEAITHFLKVGVHARQLVVGGSGRP